MSQHSQSVSSGRLGRSCPRWLGRALLAGLGPLVVFAGLEGALRLVGFGQELTFFVPDSQPGYYRSNPAFTSLFTPPSFTLRPAPFRLAKEKPAGTLRIFVIGESAVMGVPAVEFGMVRQLRALLRARHSEAAIEICNLGITAINSNVLTWAVRDAAQFSPDLLVIYMGNNEVVGPYGPGAFYSSVLPPRLVTELSIAAKRTRTGQLLGRLLTARTAQPRAWEGMRMFADSTVRATDARLPAVYTNFEGNLQAMLATAESIGAKVLLSTVVANFKDSAPFVSRHRDDLAPNALAAWQADFTAGIRAWKLGQYTEAEAKLVEARRIDPEYADTHFVLGRVMAAQGRVEEARVSYAQALHFDALRFRPDAPINDVIRRVGESAGNRVTLVDAAKTLGADVRSAAPIAGRELLFEHVHFNWAGNYALARLLADGIERALFTASPGAPGWIGPDEVAAKLGYNPLAKLRVLHADDDQDSIEPFSGQITYAEDRRARAREIADVAASLTDPATGTISRTLLDEILSGLDRAILEDPAEPALWRLRFEVNFTRLDFAACLRDLDQIARLEVQAGDGVAVLRAQVLRVQGRAPEAEALLKTVAAREGNPPEALKWLVRLHRERKDEEGAKALLRERMNDPVAAHTLQLPLVRLCLDTGAYGEALLEASQRLERNPRDSQALDLVCAAHRAMQQEDSIPAVRLRYAAAQPRNFENNLWLADHFEAAGDATRTLYFLQAAVDCGEGDSNLILRLAKLQSDQNQFDDMMINLHQAHRVALNEHNTTAAEEIGKLVDFYRKREASRVPLRR